METIKANSLMLNDWVKIKEPNKYAGAIGTIRNLSSLEGAYLAIYINDPDFGTFVTDVFCEDIEPIPLTAEVLEKNGWYIPINSCWWHNDEIDFYLVGYTDGSFQIYTDGDSEFSDLCRINHVHELQNLYRICRISKEIVL